MKLILSNLKIVKCFVKYYYENELNLYSYQHSLEKEIRRFKSKKAKKNAILKFSILYFNKKGKRYNASKISQTWGKELENKNKYVFNNSGKSRNMETGNFSRKTENDSF